MKTPVSIITGYLGAGKTTLLRRIISEYPQKLAILMNEFGEVGIDGKVVKGKNIEMVELSGGCVCCSLIGEFENALKEIIGKVKPEMIVVETTGVAEPDALVTDLGDIPLVRLDSVITIADCDALLRFPSLGHTGRAQLEAADIILLNKIDLANEMEDKVEEKVKSINSHAQLFRAVKCDVDINLLFGFHTDKKTAQRVKEHKPEAESFSYSPKPLKRERFELFLQELEGVYRAKGFVRFRDGPYLFNYVAGRWDFEQFKAKESRLVFIGNDVRKREKEILEGLKGCEK